MLDWIKRQPVLASRILDGILVIVGIALHKYGLDIPAEIKGTLDMLLIAIATGGTVAARSNVVPSVKLPESTIAKAADMTVKDIARVEAVKAEGK